MYSLCQHAAYNLSIHIQRVRSVFMDHEHHHNEIEGSYCRRLFQGSSRRWPVASCGLSRPVLNSAVHEAQACCTQADADAVQSMSQQSPSMLARKDQHDAWRMAPMLKATHAQIGRRQRQKKGDTNCSTHLMLNLPAGS